MTKREGTKPVTERRNERARKRLRRRETRVMSPDELIPLIKSLQWYALRTPAQKEFIAQEVLTQKGLITYRPTDKRWRRRNKYQKEKELISYSLIPRTVFVGFEPGIPLWFDIFSLPAVTSVVGIAGVPKPLDGKGMANLITKFANGIQRPKEEKHMPSGKEFKAGDMVRISDGPFSGMTVPVHEVRGKEARVLMDLFGTQHEVSINAWLLEAA